MSLIDIGANLAHDSFDADFAAMLARARAAGLSRIIVTGSSRDSTQRAITLSREHPGFLHATAGLHPHHASEWNEELAAFFAEAALAPEVCALGECGLDYFRNYSPHEDQRRAFAAQLKLAVDSGKPLFLHQRDAHADFHAMLREHRAQLGAVVVHCFTDTREALQDYLALDCHIGITGWICDERRGRHLLEAVRDIPDARLLLETDAPYLLPRTAPKSASRRNEPALLPYVLRAVAQARGQDEEQVARFTSANARVFFALPEN
ncbi:TatD DNase family protein [Solimonas aquatica]|uniref:TatD DNase family protein n=1 Tax=Solimonas aquatica TaxID=489703 RepID=A0A1H9E1N3_9GAMM|nr:TatD family hydrolase [Solimonas aquatica]SEQ19585.1 TatD DNase family protein [Solimonas aquatica]